MYANSFTIVFPFKLMKIVLLFQTYYVPQELQIIAQENDLIGIFHYNDSTSNTSLYMERYLEKQPSVSRVCKRPTYDDYSDVMQLNLIYVFRSPALEPYVESKLREGIFRFIA